MLQPNSIYRTIAAQDQENRRGTYQNIGQIGSGVVALVYHLKDTANNLYAAKVPRGSEDHARTRSEYDILKQLGAYFREKGTGPLPVPETLAPRAKVQAPAEVSLRCPYLP